MHSAMNDIDFALTIICMVVRHGLQYKLIGRQLIGHPSYHRLQAMEAKDQRIVELRRALTEARSEITALLNPPMGRDLPLISSSEAGPADAQ